MNSIFEMEEMWLHYYPYLPKLILPFSLTPFLTTVTCSEELFLILFCFLFYGQEWISNNSKGETSVHWNPLAAEDTAQTQGIDTWSSSL